MDQALTPNAVMQIVGFLGLLAGLWWRVETRISSGSREAIRKAEMAQSQLNDFKLEVAEKYAKNGFLKDVEDRLGQRFDAIVAELHGMRSDFNKAMVDSAKGNRTQR